MNHENNYKPPILSGQHNFRSLGGIPAAGKKKIKEGMLFRSGDLHSITDADVVLLEQMNLSMIIDFRSQREREIRPNREINTIRKTCHYEIHDEPRERAAKYVEIRNEEGLNQLLVDEYPRIIKNYKGQYRRFFSDLESTSLLPLVFQCSAGKDRTGLAAIFLLTALGVPREDILSDYYATNHYALAHATEIIGIINKKGYNGELMRPLLEVRPEYLDAGIREIESHSGNLMDFVVKELKADVVRLRDKFLENEN
jgi:protein-tyrosine phosphatase